MQDPASRLAIKPFRSVESNGSIIKKTVERWKFKTCKGENCKDNSENDTEWSGMNIVKIIR